MTVSWCRSDSELEVVTCSGAGVTWELGQSRCENKQVEGNVRSFSATLPPTVSSRLLAPDGCSGALCISLGTSFPIASLEPHNTLNWQGWNKVWVAVTVVAEGLPHISPDSQTTVGLGGWPGRGEQLYP